LADRVDEFNAAILESMDDAIKSILSQDVADAFRANLKSKRAIDANEIPDNLPTISIVLRKYFGPSARTIENAIVQRLYSKYGIEFERNPDYQLSDYVKIARSKLDFIPPKIGEPPSPASGRLALKEDFDHLLIESVREAIVDAIGKDRAELAFRILEHDVPFGKLPNRLPVFYSSLNKMFGKDHRAMEMAIARKLYVKLALDFVETPDTGLARYIEQAIIQLNRREQLSFSISSS